MNTNTNELTNCCVNCGCVDEELFKVYIDGETKTLCRDCLERLGYRQCDDCGEWYRYLLSVDDGDKWVCEDCSDYYYRCEDCGDLFTGRNVRTDHVGTVVCDDCYNRRWYTCNDCGRLVYQDEAFWSERDGEYYCEYCYDDHRGSDNLNEYGYKPSPDFHSRSSEHEDYKLFLGVELEVDDGEGSDVLCDELNELCLPIYMKHDGSLNDEGVEIVTHPCTLNYHMYEFKWGSIISTCTDYGYKSHETSTCGLHVHVNRSFFDDKCGRDIGAGNLVLLANALWSELVTFSRRKPGRLEQWSARPYLRYWDKIINAVSGGEEFSDDDLTDMALGTSCGGRYQAINLTNHDTVEFRLFRGTLKKSTLIATLQLVSNMTRFASEHTPTECVNAKWVDVMAVSQFKELDEYCESLNLPTR